MKDSGKQFSPIEKRLDQWKISAPTDPQIKQHVLRRIAVLESQKAEGANSLASALNWIARNTLASSALACTAIFLGSTIFLLVRESAIERQMDLQSRSYFLHIDPVARAASVNPASSLNPVNQPSVVDMLAWMQERFDLSREQFRALVDLHNEYDDRLVTLYNELSAIDTEYQTFETKRQKNENVDFMALYDLLQRRDVVRKDSINTSHQLVDLILRVLTQEQKLEFMSLLNKDTTPRNLPKVIPTNAGA